MKPEARRGEVVHHPVKVTNLNFNSFIYIFISNHALAFSFQIPSQSFQIFGHKNDLMDFWNSQNVDFLRLTTWRYATDANISKQTSQAQIDVAPSISVVKVM